VHFARLFTSPSLFCVSTLVSLDDDDTTQEPRDAVAAEVVGAKLLGFGPQAVTFVGSG
jgi:hypothetical protein